MVLPVKYYYKKRSLVLYNKTADKKKGSAEFAAFFLIPSDTFIFYPQSRNIHYFHRFRRAGLPPYPALFAPPFLEFRVSFYPA